MDDPIHGFTHGLLERAEFSDVGLADLGGTRLFQEFSGSHRMGEADD
jgi:hypothetical protein